MDSRSQLVLSNAVVDYVQSVHRLIQLFQQTVGLYKVLLNITPLSLQSLTCSTLLEWEYGSTIRCRPFTDNHLLKQMRLDYLRRRKGEFI